MLPLTGIFITFALATIFISYTYQGVDLYLPSSFSPLTRALGSLKGISYTKNRPGSDRPTLGIAGTKPSVFKPVFKPVWSTFGLDDQHDDNHPKPTLVKSRVPEAPTRTFTVLIYVSNTSPGQQTGLASHIRYNTTRTITAYRFPPTETPLGASNATDRNNDRDNKNKNRYTYTITKYRRKHVTRTVTSHGPIKVDQMATSADESARIKPTPFDTNKEAGFQEIIDQSDQADQSELSPAQKANLKNYIWLTIPFTGLRLAFYIVVPPRMCISLKYEFLCWETTQEEIDLMLGQISVVAVPGLLFFAGCLCAAVMDSLKIVVGSLTRLKRRYFCFY
ncbi:hypothetical protein J3Q64DRAFT_1767150 [Phycomyces blakesleeanus]